MWVGLSCLTSDICCVKSPKTPTHHSCKFPLLLLSLTHTIVHTLTHTIPQTHYPWTSNSSMKTSTSYLHTHTNSSLPLKVEQWHGDLPQQLGTLALLVGVGRGAAGALTGHAIQGESQHGLQGQKSHRHGEVDPGETQQQVLTFYIGFQCEHL